MKLRIGTRGSALALAQARLVSEALTSRHSGLPIELVRIVTSGDRFSAAGSQPADKGLFVKEIEEALAQGRVDLAVHSAKDLPVDSMPGLVMAAYPRREDPRDAFMGKNGLTWAQVGPGARVGTSSLRRQAQLLAARPGLVMVPMRGNVDTRLRKLEAGACDFLVLAVAGLRRLGIQAPYEALPEEVVLPSPGQGALAVQARSDNGEVLKMLADLDHEPTRVEVELERAFLKEMGGGCSAPLGARAVCGPGEAKMSVFFADADGKRAVRLSAACRDLGRAREFVRDLAGQVLGRRREL